MPAPLRSRAAPLRPVRRAPGSRQAPARLDRGVPSGAPAGLEARDRRRRSSPAIATAKSSSRAPRATRRSCLTGYQTGLPLHELYSHAGLFVLPSAAEGHPIALLEAAVYEVPLLASAIPANLALPLPRDRYFPVGDTRRSRTQLKANDARNPRPHVPPRRALHAAVARTIRGAKPPSSRARCTAMSLGSAWLAVAQMPS